MRRMLMPTQIKLEEWRNTNSDFEESKNFWKSIYIDKNVIVSILGRYLSFAKRMQKSESERIRFGEMWKT